MVGLLTALLAGVVLLGSNAPAPAKAQATPPVLVRFAHAFPTDTAVDIYVDNALVVGGLARGTATPHVRFDPTTVQIAVREAGADRADAPLTTREVALATTAGGFGHMTLVVQPDGFGQPTIRVIEDLLSPTRFGGSRLHLIHTVPDVAAVDVLLDSGTPFLSGATFSDPIGTLDPPDGTFTFVITDARGALATTEAVDMASGFLYTLLFYQNPDASLAVSVLSTPVLPDPNAPTTVVQWVHASASAGPLDVYIADTLIAPNVNVGEIIPHAPYASGTVTVRLRNAGLPASAAPAYETTLDLSGEAVTVVASGDLGEGTFALSVLEDAISTLTPDNVRIRIVNGTSNGPLTLQLGDDAPLVNTLPVGEASGALTLLPGRYDFSAIVDDAALGGPIFIDAADQALTGGSWITVVAANPALAADPVLIISASPFQNRAVSQPDFAAAPPPTATPTLTHTPTNTPLPPSATPTPFVGTPPPAPTQPLVVADVNVNAGVNLQCREYPSTTARSIGLIPSDVRLVVLGYAGPLDPSINNNVPVDPALFANPESATAFEQIWIQTEFYDPTLDYQLTRCWVRSDFVVFYFFDGVELNYISDPAGFFAFVVLDPPLITQIPANRPGTLVGSGVSNPPAIVLPPPTATPTLTPSFTPSPTITPTGTPDTSVRARVATTANLYERASVESAVLRSIPTGSVVIVVARNLDGTLLNVYYEVLGEGTYIGWVVPSAVALLDGAAIASLPVGQ